MKQAPRNIKTAAIVTVGDELMTGLVVDTNAAAIARFLLRRGYRIAGKSSAGDALPAIIASVRAAMRRADIVVVTGGLGPTHDDLTKEALRRLFKCGVKFNPAVLRQVQSFFTRMGKPMPKINRDYADIPAAAVAVRNMMGAAPGLFFQKRVLALPGVPHETLYMLEHEAAKFIPHGGAHIAEKTFHTAGVGEVGLMAQMKELKEARKVADIAFLPGNGGVDIRLLARGNTPANAQALLKEAVALIYPAIKGNVWGMDGETIESAVGKLLRKWKKTLAVAESCTGGGIGKKITATPGSSDYFIGGIISYANRVKEKMLGVPAAIIKEHGAVSSECAEAMAEGVRNRLGADYVLAVTGVAGPDGGTKEKPIGLVYVAIAAKGWVKVRRLNLAGSRETIRERAANEALFFLREILSIRQKDKG
ncbi:MAG: CinA family nicotinamide mononucleotide deamidase-related protein [Nitrospinae bacterium]|nr:CinA family nicotinamide mononucleotide deamidase-related protein [Nitrospinota bacterium]